MNRETGTIQRFSFPRSLLYVVWLVAQVLVLRDEAFNELFIQQLKFCSVPDISKGSTLLLISMPDERRKRSVGRTRRRYQFFIIFNENICHRWTRMNMRLNLMSFESIYFCAHAARKFFFGSITLKKRIFL
jgi:hypothetical protein